ncbi:universal stress protein [Mesorhizobium sp. BAC0120]|uniref:universal stress protein n=1 Tax=Mesorhizobium sp. BAC0120 TaxID=3090670 RepID=UPI00298D4C02|nr:universal stress protein [Mesorhizobium sp. BAC0120]MDW6022530.1 universal stress protein [Mesorhizobium sp. BAC0120]
MYKHILIPSDGSELSQKAVAHGIELAAALDARVTALTVTIPYHSLELDPAPVADIPGAADFVREYLHGRPKLYLEAVETAARVKGVTCETLQIEHDHPYVAIIETAQAKGCDLIVMASHGRSGLSAIVLGSETVKVLTHTKIPVLVHRS